MRDELASLFCLALLSVSCAKSTPPLRDKNTNWLRECNGDSSCGDALSCVCGLCTKSCRRTSDCAEAGSAVACETTDSTALSDRCTRAEAETVSAICVASCTRDRDCSQLGADLACREGLCVAAVGSLDGGGVDGGEVDSGEIDGGHMAPDATTDTGTDSGSDGRSVEPPDPCAVDNGGCEELCANGGSGVTCSCEADHALDPDGRTCRTWSDAEYISDLSYGGELALAVNAAGHAMVVARNSSEALTYAIRHLPDGGWGDSIVIDDAHTDDDWTSPQLAMDASGNALLVWKGGYVLSAESWEHQLLFQRYDAVEDRWSAAEVIDGWSDEPVNGSASWNALRMDGAGNALAVWGGRGVSVSRWSAAAKAWEAPVVLDGDRSARAPALAVDAAGNAVVAWMRGDATWAARYEAGVGWEAVVAIDAGSAGDPLLAMDEAGNALASWQSGAGLWVARFEPGSGWGGALDLENEDAANGGPRLAVERSGNAFVAWASAGEIWTRRYELGKGWGDATDVSVGARKPSEPPELAVDDAGNAFLVWLAVPAFGEEAVWANAYVAGGWGEATELEPDVFSSLPLVRLAVHSGQALALWSSEQGLAASRFANGEWSPRMPLKNTGKRSFAEELHLTGLAGGFVAVWNVDESFMINGATIDVMSTYAAHYR